MPSVSLAKIVEKMKLESLTPEIDIKGIKIKQPDINRPALQIAGFFEHYEATRLQIIGFVEYKYMMSLSDERKEEIYTKLLSYPIPCIVFCRELEPDELFLKKAIENNVPLFKTKKTTSAFMAEIIRWLNVKLAPCISVHGVLVDVYGEGVLIVGESGIGKSEAALELVKRGHRLVTDDVVEIRKVSDDTIIGTAPDITKHFIEIRGVGIVDVKTYTFDGDNCVAVERLYTFPSQMSALRHYRDAIEKAELYDNIELFKNQVRYKLKEGQHKVETDGLTKEQMKAKFGKQIDEAKADMKKMDDKMKHDKGDHHKKHDRK